MCETISIIFGGQVGVYYLNFEYKRKHLMYILLLPLTCPLFFGNSFTNFTSRSHSVKVLQRDLLMIIISAVRGHVFVPPPTTTTTANLDD